MKRTLYTHHLLIPAIVLSLLISTAIADDDVAAKAPPSAEQIAQDEPKLQIKTETIYETSFLPGVRLCEEDEVEYRGDFRKINCQDEALIDAVSTRKEDPYNTGPKTVVNDRVEPNGNIFRINFRRKATIVQETSEH